MAEIVSIHEAGSTALIPLSRAARAESDRFVGAVKSWCEVFGEDFLWLGLPGTTGTFHCLRRSQATGQDPAGWEECQQLLAAIGDCHPEFAKTAGTGWILFFREATCVVICDERKPKIVVGLSRGCDADLCRQVFGTPAVQIDPTSLDRQHSAGVFATERVAPPAQKCDSIFPKGLM